MTSAHALLSRPRRVLVATGLNDGDKEYKNLGDVAMLQVAVGRLLALPQSRIAVLTDSPADLASFCPGAEPVPRLGARAWTDNRVLLGRLHGHMPKWLSIALSGMKRDIALRYPALLRRVLKLRFSFKDSGGRRRALDAFLEELSQADVLVVCGSGGFADSCLEWNHFILNLIEAAQARGIPVALVGQGIGPLEDTAVLARARKILPGVHLLAHRGTYCAEVLLAALSIPPARIFLTGDDATELAWLAASASATGKDIGVNLRVAAYSQVNAKTIATVGTVLDAYARSHDAALLPMPIAVHSFADDRHTIRDMLAVSSAFLDNADSLDTPDALIRQATRCRVVVTGAYHAAVFALAQGIPAVCLTASDYYSAKFRGLQQLYGDGCFLIELSGPGLAERLGAILEQAWTSAQDLREPLLRAAARQVCQGRAAYTVISTILDTNMSIPHEVGTESVAAEAATAR